MAGKAYTMREMKSIVDYLTEHKAYGETKGRKMWMEYANSQHTTRTWQSLKETFLKRILPSIHDPYYKLSMEQIRSFKQGCDIVEKEKKNRLVIRTESDDSGKNENKQPTTSKDNKHETAGVDDEEPSTSIDKEVEKVTGEGVTCEKISSRNRSSVDTVVLEYENAEEIQRDLESPKNENADKLKTKSFKDLLTFEYTAPSTPQVQELADAFETESEASDKEPQLNIDENPCEITEPEVSQSIILNKQDKDNAPDSVIIIQDSDSLNNIEANSNGLPEKENENHEVTQLESLKVVNTSQNENIKDNNNKDAINIQKQNIEIDLQNNESLNSQDDTNRVTLDTHSVVTKLADATAVKHIKETKIQTQNSVHSTQNTENITSDTILPNNQEAFNNSKKVSQNVDVDNTCSGSNEVETSKNRSEKRSSSQDTRDSKKQKVSDEKMDQPEVDKTTPIIEVLSKPLIEYDTLSKNGKSQEKSISKKQDAITNNKENSQNERKDIEIVEDKNPCLLSVSLYDEQFKNIEYSDSDSDDEATSASKQNANKEKYQSKKQKETDINLAKNDKKGPNVIVLDNDSEEKRKEESSSGNQKHKTKDTKQNKDITVSLERERALANVFGFAQGGGATRKRQMSHRRKSHQRHRKISQIESDSSEWTSDDSDSYVSPPRGRRHKHTKKYLKPKASRVLKDPEEGFMYVLLGKSIYPLVKDGKHVKNFLTFRPESTSDYEDDSYWKQKYIEEKKKADEYKGLLRESRVKVPQMSDPVSISSRSSPANPPSPLKKNSVSDKLASPPLEEVNKIDTKNNKLTLKIASKNGLECCLEGGWSQISNAMPQMFKMLTNNITPDQIESEEAPQKTPKQENAETLAKPQELMEVSSGISTPIVPPTVDPVVHEAVNKIETEIFKEIEDREKEDKQSEVKAVNVTKRRGRAKKDSTSSVSSIHTPVKRARISKTVSTETKPETNSTKVNQTKQPAEQIVPQESKRLTRSRVNSTRTSNQQTSEQEKNQMEAILPVVIQDNVSTNEKSGKQKGNLPSTSKKRDTGDHIGDGESTDKAESTSSVRQLRTPKKCDTDSSASDVKLKPKKSSSKESKVLQAFDEDAHFMFPPTTKDSNTKGNMRSMPDLDTIPQTQKNRFTNSIDSSDEYQDSDTSIIRLSLPKRKKKLSLYYPRRHRDKFEIRRSCPILLQKLPDSSNSSYFIPLRSSQSTINSAVYNTESFQLLMNKPKIPCNKLAPIKETDGILVQSVPNIRHFNSFTYSDNLIGNKSNGNLEVASSSNMSLPISPEISIVEKMSISREIVKNNNHQIINETQVKGNSDEISYSEYMLPNLDASIPLMNQQCDLQQKRQTVPPKQTSKKSFIYADAKLHKECSVRIENLTLSETLDQRLRDLLLESNKKPNNVAMKVDPPPKKARAKKSKVIPMEVDESNVKVTKKPKGKRSSTPNEKKLAKKSKASKDPVIVEECLESCSYRGRQSCPPVLSFLAIDENANNSADISIKPAKGKAKATKNIIKAKVQKPTDKREIKEKNQEKTVNNSTISVYTDSGINEADTFSVIYPNLSAGSVELIHNHSETCLLAKECLNDSVEIVNSSKSIISLSSSGQSIENELQKLLGDTGNVSNELCEQDKATYEGKISDENFASPDTVYLSLNASSVMTEDLSEERSTQSRNWYLFSDEDTNTQASNTQGSNLNQIFPITCAVPNLSTITETSKENENSERYEPSDTNVIEYDFQSLLDSLTK